MTLFNHILSNGEGMCVAVIVNDMSEINSFVYWQRRLFHPARLYQAITEDDILNGVVRTGEYGDRRQELVCIGVEVDKATLHAKLDACLLTNVKMALGWRAWRRFDDPFMAWAAEEELIMEVLCHHQ